MDDGIDAGSLTEKGERSRDRAFELDMSINC